MCSVRKGNKHKNKKKKQRQKIVSSEEKSRKEDRSLSNKKKEMGSVTVPTDLICITVRNLLCAVQL